VDDTRLCCPELLIIQGTRGMQGDQALLLGGNPCTVTSGARGLPGRRASRSSEGIEPLRRPHAAETSAGKPEISVITT